MGATLRWGALVSHCSDFSCCGARTRVGSVVVAPGLWGCGAQGKLPQCLWNLPRPGMETMSPTLAGRQPGDPLLWSLRLMPPWTGDAIMGTRTSSGWVKQAQLLPCRDLQFRCFKLLSIVRELWDFELEQGRLWKILFPRAGTFFTGYLAVQEQLYLPPLVLQIKKKSNVTWIFRPLKEANQLRSPFWLEGENHQSDLPGTFSTHFTCRKIGTPPGEIKDEYLLESNNSGENKFCIFQWKKWGDNFVFPPGISDSVDHFWYTYS